jgi:TetR/AcrR family transcriptional repressor of lmrAB and yxaGH operons
MENAPVTATLAPPRQRLVETAARLFQAHGYHQVGLNQIVAESGTPKGSLYHYFPSGKEALAVAAIEHAAERVAMALHQLTQAHTGTRVALAAVVDFFIQELDGSGFRKGCPVATLALEQAAHSAPLQQACARAYQLWELALADYLLAQGVAQPGQKAAQLLVMLEGALVVSRARLDCAPLRQLKDLLLANFN